MNRLLKHDLNIFMNDHPKAYNFLQNAHLRYEYYNLLHITPSSLNTWQEKRIVELSNTPACQTEWLNKVKSERARIYL